MLTLIDLKAEKFHKHHSSSESAVTQRDLRDIANCSLTCMMIVLINKKAYEIPEQTTDDAGIQS